MWIVKWCMKVNLNNQSNVSNLFAASYSEGRFPTFIL